LIDPCGGGRDGFGRDRFAGRFQSRGGVGHDFG
jgi:hypothetical protein